MKITDPVLEWLLEFDNPPVRYLTLINLLNLQDKSQEVQKAKSYLMEYKVTQGILKHSKEFLNANDREYWKYTGIYWQLIFLGQFLADGKDSRIEEGIHKILNKPKWVNQRGGQCLTANLLAAFRRLGYSDHPVVIEETESLAKRTVEDGGINCTVMDYSLLPQCYMALPKLLHLFAEIPPPGRSENVNKAIDLIIKRLLDNEIYLYIPSNRKDWQKIIDSAPKRSDLPGGQTVKEWVFKKRNEFHDSYGPGERLPKQGWLKFGFPLHYNSDILETMYVLALLGTSNTPELNKALGIINDKKTPEGKWKMESSLNGKMWADVEEKGKHSKWITYFALYVQNHFGI